MTKALCNWKEADLIEWLKENIYPDLVKAKNQMSRWDCYSPEAHHRIELKCRRKHYDTLLIERGKYEAVLLESKKHLDIPIFIASTPEGVFSFNLLIVNFEWEVNSRNPRTTQFGGNERVTKEVAYMNVKEATQLL